MMKVLHCDVSCVRRHCSAFHPTYNLGTLVVLFSLTSNKIVVVRQTNMYNFNIVKSKAHCLQLYKVSPSRL